MAISTRDTGRMSIEADPDLQALITLGLVEPVEVNGRTEYRLSSALTSPNYTPNAPLIEPLQANHRSGEETRLQNGS